MKSILMVDDVAVNLKCAEEILKDKYELTSVKSGKGALAALKRHCPDLILLDINMPEMNGFEVFERIKAEPKTANIPVVFVTAESNREAEIKSIAMGAVGFIRKPYDPETLSRRVEKVLTIYHREMESPEEARQDGISYELRQENLKEITAKADASLTEGYFILMNMDNFRQINSAYGAAAGDDILTKTAAVLKEEVAETGCICHIGGDAFLMFIEGKMERDYIRTVIRRIIAGVEFEINESLPEEYKVTVSLSAGIAEKPQDGNNFKVLYERADKALYYVKQGGKRSYHFYNSDAEEIQQASDEKNMINVLQLQRLFRGRENAIADQQESLKKASRMVLRYWNSKTPIQLIIFYITDSHSLTEDALLEKKLKEVVSGSLRKGDAAVKCGRLQYLVMLQNVSGENADMVARRIKKKFEESIEDSVILLQYEMNSVLPQQK